MGYSGCATVLFTYFPLWKPNEKTSQPRRYRCCLGPAPGRDVHSCCCPSTGRGACSASRTGCRTSSSARRQSRPDQGQGQEGQKSQESQKSQGRQTSRLRPSARIKKPAHSGLFFCRKRHNSAPEKRGIRQSHARKTREAQPVVQAKSLEAGLAPAVADQPSVP